METVSFRPRNRAALKGQKPLSLLLLVFLSVVFYFALSYVYVDSISVIFRSTRLTQDYSTEQFVNGLVALLFVSLLSPKKGLGVYFAGILILFVYVPSLVFYAAGPASSEYVALKTFAISIVILTMRISKVPVPYITSVSINGMIKFFIIVSIVYFAVVISQGGLRYFNLDLNRVYDLRVEAAQNLGSIFGYISPILGKVAVPAMVVLAMRRKNYFIALMAMLIGVGLFAFTAHKSPIFYGLCTALIYASYKSESKIILFMGAALIAITIIGIFDLRLATDNGLPFNQQSYGTIGNLFLRRAIMVPALLDAVWIEYFTDNAKLYWSESRFTFGLIDRPYDLTSPKVIGREMFNLPDLAANTGWVGAGIAQAGIIGLGIYSVVLGLFLSFLNTAAERLGKGFVAGFSFPVVYTIFLSADLVTSILTHGLLALIVCMTLLYYSRELSKSY